MEETLLDHKEVIIKSKKRVQKHGEVFTPKRIVKMMLDQDGIKEACESLTATFLEPSAGEGAFLAEILFRKLKMVQSRYNDNLKQYEMNALFALTTIYGVELLEDNAQCCVMTLFKIFCDNYQKVAEDHGDKVRDKIFRAAKYIISKNLVQGNFLTQEQSNGEPIIFSEWKLLPIRKNHTIRVQRTEYTLDEIGKDVKHEDGFIHGSNYLPKAEQGSLFDIIDEENDGQLESQFIYHDETNACTDMEEGAEKLYRYLPCRVEDVYLEKKEEIDVTYAD